MPPARLVPWSSHAGRSFGCRRAPGMRRQHVVWIPDSELGTWEAALENAAGLQLIRVCREGEAMARGRRPAAGRPATDRRDPVYRPVRGRGCPAEHHPRPEAAALPGRLACAAIMPISGKRQTIPALSSPSRSCRPGKSPTSFSTNATRRETWPRFTDRPDRKSGRARCSWRSKQIGMAEGPEQETKEAMMTQREALEVLAAHRGERIVITTMSSAGHLAGPVRYAA